MIENNVLEIATSHIFLFKRNHRLINAIYNVQIKNNEWVEYGQPRDTTKATIYKMKRSLTLKLYQKTHACNVEKTYEYIFCDLTTAMRQWYEIMTQKAKLFFFVFVRASVWETKQQIFRWNYIYTHTHTSPTDRTCVEYVSLAMFLGMHCNEWIWMGKQWNFKWIWCNTEPVHWRASSVNDEIDSTNMQRQIATDQSLRIVYVCACACVFDL